MFCHAELTKETVGENEPIRMISMIPLYTFVFAEPFEYREVSKKKIIESSLYVALMETVKIQFGVNRHIQSVSNATTITILIAPFPVNNIYVLARQVLRRT